jgi:para-aminobenzoate synthetase component 1
MEALAVALARDCAAPFWLDSGLDVGDQGRFSFLGAEPVGRLRNRGLWNELWWEERHVAWRGDPFDAICRILGRRQISLPEGAPPFVGGAVGYLGYGLRHHVERLPRRGRDDLGLPDCALAFYDAVLAYEHATGAFTLCSIDPRGRAAKRLREVVGSLHDAGSEPAIEVAPGTAGSPPSRTPFRVGAGRLPAVPAAVSTAGLTAALRPRDRTPDLRCNFTRPAYLRAVQRVLDYIAAGDIYQVNLSQRFSTSYAGDALDLYRRLRRQTPAPFGAYVGFEEAAILSASPERFLQIRGREVITRPIKGTRPRGGTPDEDRRLAAELLASEKDRAELVMIVDLERNDLGKVCEYGSVHVPELVRLEEHPTVLHLVATVAGRLRPEVTPVECLRACFPGGSITGAPKIRAMEIIEELEPTQRGPYTGAIGYLGWDGAVDLNIAIRTIVVANGEAHFQVGGGIVADSDPEAEYEETLHKGRALMRALRVSDG